MLPRRRRNKETKRERSSRPDPKTNIHNAAGRKAIKTQLGCCKSNEQKKQAANQHLGCMNAQSQSQSHPNPVQSNPVSIAGHLMRKQFKMKRKRKERRSIKHPCAATALQSSNSPSFCGRARRPRRRAAGRGPRAASRRRGRRRRGAHARGAAGCRAAGTCARGRRGRTGTRSPASRAPGHGGSSRSCA